MLSSGNGKRKAAPHKGATYIELYLTSCICQLTENPSRLILYSAFFRTKCRFQLEFTPDRDPGRGQASF